MNMVNFCISLVLSIFKDCDIVAYHSDLKKIYYTKEHDLLYYCGKSYYLYFKLKCSIFQRFIFNWDNMLLKILDSILRLFGLQTLHPQT